VVSAVLEHVRWRITAVGSYGGSMSGAETAGDVAPHTMTAHGQDSIVVSHDDEDGVQAQEHGGWC